MNNPTLWDFCVSMIGRADIEGSKSDVAMNAWPPQASYPCGNFSGTSSPSVRGPKGSIGRAFAVSALTGSEIRTSLSPSRQHEISVPTELLLGHLRYVVTDVPPQPNSPPASVARPTAHSFARQRAPNSARAPPSITG